MRFSCSKCGEVHEGVPGFGWDYPVSYIAVPVAERSSRCALTSDTCAIDDAQFFVRGCLEIPVHGETDPFVWGVWASVSRSSFAQFLGVYDASKRSEVGPFFGWLESHIWLYPDTINLKSRVHLRDHGVRPFIELQPTEHPLAREQKEGLDARRVIEIFEAMAHPPGITS
jgi:hypothetical protein